MLDADRAWTWGTLNALADKYARALEGTRGGIDVLWLPGSGDAVALIAAADRARRQAILIAPHDEARAHTVGAAFDARIVTTVDQQLRVLRDPPAASTSTSDEPAVLVMTSGTTGAPKCARHSWATLTAAVKHGVTYAERRWLCAYPLSHFAGLQVLAQCVFNRGSLVIPRGFGAEAGLHALREHRASYLCSTPTYLRQLLMASTPDEWRDLALEHVTLGGEIVDQHILDSLQQYRPVVHITHTYASTELGAILTVRDGREGFDVALLAEGNIEIREGEMFVRRTARAMLGYAGGSASADEWVATGDVVEVRDGRVLFRGRTRDVINVGGYKVSPIEVETVIRGVDGVRDVCVVGRKSSVVGNIVKAMVVPRSSVDRDVLRQQIQQRCREQLAHYMVPRIIEFQDELARGVSQKLVRD